MFNFRGGIANLRGPRFPSRNRRPMFCDDNGIRWVTMVIKCYIWSYAAPINGLTNG